MNSDQGHMKLLDDVLGDADLDALRDDLLHRCRAELAAKRRARLRWLVLPAAAAALLICLRLFDLTGGGLEPSGPDDVAEGAVPHYVVETVPLAVELAVSTSSVAVQECVVRTKPADRVVTSTPSTAEECMVLTTAAGDLAVHTEHDVERITDSDLLAMFPEAPRGLVGPPGGKKLVFLDPEDEARYRPKAK